MGMDGMLLALFLRGLSRVCTIRDSRVGIIDVHAVRAIQGRVLKLPDKLFLIAISMERRTKLGDCPLPNSPMEFYLLSHIFP